LLLTIFRESFLHSASITALCYRSDGKELASTSTDGQIYIWDPENGQQLGFINGMLDLITHPDARSKNHFTSLSYTADGKNLIAGSKQLFVCLYNIEAKLVLRKFEVYPTLELVEKKDDDERRKITEVFDVQFDPSGRQWACATSGGLFVYSLDANNQDYQPFELDIDISTSTIYNTLVNKQYLKAFVMSLQLNDDTITAKVFESIPYDLITLTVSQLNTSFLTRFINFLVRYMNPEKGVAPPHVHFCLLWVNALLNHHGQYFQQNGSNLSTHLKSLQKSFSKMMDNLSDMCSQNGGMMSYILSSTKQRDLFESDTK